MKAASTSVVMTWCYLKLEWHKCSLSYSRGTDGSCQVMLVCFLNTVAWRVKGCTENFKKLGRAPSSKASWHALYAKESTMEIRLQYKYYQVKAFQNLQLTSGNLEIWGWQYAPSWVENEINLTCASWTIKLCGGNRSRDLEEIKKVLIDHSYIIPLYSSKSLVWQWQIHL